MFLRMLVKIFFFLLLSSFLFITHINRVLRVLLSCNKLYLGICICIYVLHNFFCIKIGAPDNFWG